MTDTRSLLVPQLDGGDLIRVRSVTTGLDLKIGWDETCPESELQLSEVVSPARPLDALETWIHIRRGSPRVRQERANRKADQEALSARRSLPHPSSEAICLARTTANPYPEQVNPSNRTQTIPIYPPYVNAHHPPEKKKKQADESVAVVTSPNTPPQRQIKPP